MTQLIPSTSSFRLVDSRHPSFLSDFVDWQKWRETFAGGDHFKQRYLERFSGRESEADFQKRKRLTPIPSFASAAITDIRNSLFSRLRDVSRNGGSAKYKQSVAGMGGGVDGLGSSMASFIGMKLLVDLLVMGRVGVFVDSSVVTGNTLATTADAKPYLYAYSVEDVLSWSCTSQESQAEFKSVLLQDSCLEMDQLTQLPVQMFQRYRLLWISEATGLVNLQFFDSHGKPVDRNSQPGEVIYELELTKIPFVMLDLGDSLMKNICDYQIALMNLTSSDVWYALNSNTVFYTEQRDLRAAGGHLKPAANDDGTATTGGQGAADKSIPVGSLHGRAYDRSMDRPAFIAPPDHTLRASMDLQKSYEEKIRSLVNLAIMSMATRASAESKSIDQQGLEAGLSYIGLVLENGERQIAEFWAAYENKVESRREVATVKYPDRYSLKTDADRLQEATKLAELLFKIPSRKAKQEVSKQIVETLLGGRSYPDTIIAAVENGLCGNQTGSIALGFTDTEYKVAEEDHIKRIERIAEAQGVNNPAARGVDDLAVDPNAAQDEKQPQRGKAKQARVTGVK